MKKFLSLALALVMVLSLGAVAFADEDPAPAPIPSSHPDMSTVTLTKNYQLVGNSTTAFSPAETFTFSDISFVSVEDAPSNVNKALVESSYMPTIGNITYVKGDAGKSGSMTKTVDITLPTYDFVGVYTYKFTENNNNTAGVSYHSGDIKLVVTVIMQGNVTRVASVHTESSSTENKSSAFDNTYSAGTLSVKKEVKGTFGDTKQTKFPIKVTFTAPSGKTVMSDISYTVGNSTTTNTISAGTSGWTGSKDVTFELGHDETATFTNLPYGVSYSVTETDAKGYTVTYTGATGTINADNSVANTTVTNTKEGTVDTGVSMDSIPYVVLLTVACLGLVVLLTKKRTARDF